MKGRKKEMTGYEEEKTEYVQSPEEKALASQVNEGYKRLAYKLERKGVLPLRQGRMLLADMNKKIGSYGDFVTEAEEAISKLPQGDQQALLDHIKVMKTQIEALKDAVKEFETGSGDTPERKVAGYLEVSKYFQSKDKFKESNEQQLKAQQEVIKDIPDAIKKIKKQIKDKTKALVELMVEKIAKDQDLSGDLKGALKGVLMTTIGENKSPKREKEALAASLTAVMRQSRHPKEVIESIVEAASPHLHKAWIDNMKSHNNQDLSSFMAGLANIIISEKSATKECQSMVDGYLASIAKVNVEASNKVRELQQRAVEESWKASRLEKEKEKVQEKKDSDVMKLNLKMGSLYRGGILLEYNGNWKGFGESTKGPVAILEDRSRRIDSMLSRQHGINDVSDALRRCMDTVTPPGEEKYPGDSLSSSSGRPGLPSFERPSSSASRSFASRSVERLSSFRRSRLSGGPSESERPRNKEETQHGMQRRRSSLGNVLQSFHRRKLTSRSPSIIDKTDDSSRRRDRDDKNSHRKSHRRKP